MINLSGFRLCGCLVLLIFVFYSLAATAQKIVSVKAMGAKGDGNFNNTAIFQKAIDECNAFGGGTVLVEHGAYVTSTLILKSNVTIQVEQGAAIKASTKVDDYTFSKGIYSTETDVPVLFYGEKLENITFCGRGLIDGQAEQTWEPLREIDNFIALETELAKNAGVEMNRAYAKDPKVSLIYLTDCKNVTLRDLRLERSPNWTVHLANCENVLALDLYIYSSLEKGVNADGLDIDGCKGVRIANCNIITGDDAICLKSTNKNGKYFPCKDVTVTNCTLISTSTALKIGTESHGDFINIVFTNSTISNTNRGIGIFVRDGATVDRVIFSNLTIECNRKHFNWWGDGDPIRFVLLKRKPDSRLGMIQNVQVSNVVAKGQGTSLIAGFYDKNIRNIQLINIDITLEAESLPDKRSTAVLKVENVDNLTLEQVQLRFSLTKQEPKWTSLLSLNNIKDFKVSNSIFEHRNNDVKQAFISARNVQNGIFTHNICRYGKTVSFVHLEGIKTSNITISGNFTEEGQRIYSTSSEVKSSQIKTT
jgi:polygalacturonase